MKNTALGAMIILIVLLLAGVAHFYYQNAGRGSQRFSALPTVRQIIPTVTHNQENSTGTPEGEKAFCTPDDLQASVVVGPAAGNIYGDMTLKNISRQSCRISGGEYINADYDTGTVKNIIVNHIGEVQPQQFTLVPGQSLYSRVHYPNGPQCHSIGLKSVRVTFTYRISPANTVTFTNQEGKTIQTVQACSSTADVTEIQIWNMSVQPITE